MQLFWTDGGGYELSYSRNRFEFDASGKLSQTLFGKLKYEYGDVSEACNVPVDITKFSGVSETRGSANIGFTCDQCSSVLETACGDGINQICNYAPAVDGVSPFNTKASNAFSKMCEIFNTACSNERASGECETKCSDPEVYGHEVSVCVEEAEVCIPSLEVSLSFDFGNADLYVSEPNGGSAAVGPSQEGDYGFSSANERNGGTETYTMYGDLSGTDMLGDYSFRAACFTPGATWTIVASSNGVELLSETGPCTASRVLVATVSTYEASSLCPTSDVDQ